MLRHIRSLAGSRRWLPWLVVGLYLLVAFALTWRIWSDPAALVPTNGGHRVSHDIYLNAWFMRYAATAISHGHLPALVTTAVNAPQGVNVMWNTSLLLPSLLLTPITLTAGPLVSLAVLLTAGLAGSAAAMFAVLRRWRVGLIGAALGGALYGFSPAILVAAEDHYHLEFAVLPPLIIDAVLSLATGRRRFQIRARLQSRMRLVRAWARLMRDWGWLLRPVLAGVWLGLLVAAQVFIAEELLLDTALACVVFVAVLAICRPRAVPGRIGAATSGAIVAIAVAVLLSGHALWVQLHGPLAERGSPWHIGQYGNQPADFVTAPEAVLFHGQYLRFMAATKQFLVEYYAYLGWPMLVLLAAVTVVCWRDARVRVAAISFALLELLSMGGHKLRIGHWYLPIDIQPWHWLWHLPLLSQIVPNRISILADGAAAAVIAFGIDRVMTKVPTAAKWRRPALSVLAAACAFAAVSIIPRPVPAFTVVPPPPGWRVAVAELHLRPSSRLLVLPLDGALVMEWQAVTGEPFSVVGGYCIVEAPNGHASQCDTYTTLLPAEQDTLLGFNRLASGGDAGDGPGRAAVATAIAAWRPAAVISIYGPRSALGRYLISLFGPPTVSQDNVLGWRIRGTLPAKLFPRLIRQPLGAGGGGGASVDSDR